MAFGNVVKAAGAKVVSAARNVSKALGKNRPAEVIREAGKQASKMGKYKAYRLAAKAIDAGVKKSVARSAALGSAVAAQFNSKAEIAKANALSQQAALDNYNKIINMIGQPAEGTGAASTGSSSGVTVIGNE